MKSADAITLDHSTLSRPLPRSPARRVLDVILEEGAPSLRRRSAALDHVLGDRRLGDFDPELEQLAMNSGCAPKRIRPAHPSNELDDLRIDLWAS
jgi:hypothetical protein